MNFGKWIVVAFILFALFIGTLVAVCLRQEVSLVSKNYYQEELAYQDQIERISNTNHLAEKPRIAKREGQLHVTFNNDLKIQKGQLKLFCPSNPKMDKEYSISGNAQLFDITSLHPGMYKAKLLWSMGGKEYFLEQVIYI
jgi:hypothetical protein